MQTLVRRQSTGNNKSQFNSQGTATLPEHSQRAFDSVVVDHMFQVLLEGQTEPCHRARLLGVTAVYSGDRLHAVPISICGFRLSDEAVRVTVGMRLGTDLSQAHRRTYGVMVDVRGSHPCFASTTQAECSVTTKTSPLNQRPDLARLDNSRYPVR